MTPSVAIILLAAGASSRMRGRDKLLEDVRGVAMLRHCAIAALGSGAEVLVVLAADRPERRAVLDGLAVKMVEAKDWRDGMAVSIRAGLAVVSPETEAVMVAFADMPDVTSAHFDALVAAYVPNQNRHFCRAVTEDGKYGHPVLFGARFFAELAALQGDKGGRDILAANAECVVNVPTPGQSAVIDIDTPEDLAGWRPGWL